MWNCVLRNWDEHSLDEVAGIIGIASKQMVSWIEKRAFRKLRERIRYEESMAERNTAKRSPMWFCNRCGMLVKGRFVRIQRGVNKVWTLKCPKCKGGR